MSERLQSVVQAVTEATTPAGLDRLLERIRALYDVDNAVYYALSLGGAQAGREYGAATYAPEWSVRYEDAGYREVDPVVHGAVSGFVPIDWGTLDWTGKQLQRFRSEAKEHEVGEQGYTIPIHGPQGQFAFFCVSRDCAGDVWSAFLSESAQDLLLIAHHVHRQVLSVTGAEAPTRSKKLSPRERDVLTLVAEGRSRAQVAERLEISESTLRVYLDSARHKLGALNTFHAVALGMKIGTIKL